MNQSFVQAKRAGVPLVMIESADPAATVLGITNVMNGKLDKLTFAKWNLADGLVGINDKGKKLANDLNDGSQMNTARPDECLAKLQRAPKDSIIVFYGAEKIVADATVRQAIWNLRDIFKSLGSMLVLVVPFGTKLTADIKDDIVVLEHSLPDTERLKQIAKSLVQDAGVKTLDEVAENKVVDATLGLSEFCAEQVVAMSITKDGVNVPSLWERKRKAIEQTQGLSVWKGNEKFDDVGGCANVKGFMQKLIKGKNPPRCVVFIDEIEKAISGQGDTSGVNQAMLGILLRWMQDKEATGSVFLGVAGSAKSAISKAVGNEAGVPTIEFDLSAMKGSLVGESENRLRSAIATVDAIAQGRVLVLATCNSIGSLPPELRRRFTLGTFFFDLPSESDRDAIWKIYEKKYGLRDTRPVDEGWTGAEIKQCCSIADRLQVSRKEAAKYVVPISVSAAQTIRTLRTSANGCYLNAAADGIYEFNPNAAVAANGGRKIERD